MNLQQRIEQLQKQLDETYCNVSWLAGQLEALLRSYTAAEQAASEQTPALWEPKAGEEMFYPGLEYALLRNGSYFDISYLSDIRVVERGLAFRTAEDASQVGEWLGVLGKIANLAKTANEGKDFGAEFYVIVESFGGLLIHDRKNFDHDRPRFHSRAAADWALSQLTEREKAVMIRGIN